MTGAAADSDGTIVKYSWVQISGPMKATLTDASTNKLVASNMIVAGFYVYKLTVTDDKGATAFDKIGVTIYAPVTTAASVGDTQILELEEEREPSWAEVSHKYWADKYVLLYDGQGKEIYKGAWHEEAYQRVVERNRFFVFNILKNGMRIKSGKYLIAR